MLADVVAGVLRLKQFEVNAEYGPRERWRQAAESHKADVVVTSLQEGSLAEEGTKLLWETPRLRVIALRQNASEALLLELAPRIEALGELSPEDLAAAVASAARPRGAVEIIGANRKRDGV